MVDFVHDAEHQILNGRVQLWMNDHGVGDGYRAKFKLGLCGCQVNRRWRQRGDMQKPEVAVKSLGVFQVDLQNIWADEQRLDLGVFWGVHEKTNVQQTRIHSVNAFLGR